MDLNKEIANIDDANAQAELKHVEATQGPKYVISDAEINAWMDGTTQNVVNI